MSVPPSNKVKLGRRAPGSAKSKTPSTRKSNSNNAFKMEFNTLDQERVCLFAVDKHYRYTYANAATLAFLGIEREQIVGATLEDVFPAMEAERHRGLFEKIFRTGQPHFSESPTVSPVTKRAYSALKFPLFDERGNVVAVGGVALDTNDQMKTRRKEEIRRSLNFHASKLAWLGEMAGGVAHEINNPLAVIHGHANLLRDDAVRGKLNIEKILRATEKIEAMVHRINRIVVSLKEMASDSEGLPFQKASLKSLIENTSQLFRVAHEEGPLVQVDSVPDSLAIDCRSTQIAQVLMHLILNAKDAIRSADQKWIRIQAKEKGDFVEIRVIDSGQGVPAPLRERIFDPFVTTGHPGRSSGLGLPIARRICEQHGGSLELVAGAKHTTFSMTLPKARSID